MLKLSSVLSNSSIYRPLKNAAVPLSAAKILPSTSFRKASKRSKELKRQAKLKFQEIMMDKTDPFYLAQKEEFSEKNMNITLSNIIKNENIKAALKHLSTMIKKHHARPTVFLINKLLLLIENHQVAASEAPKPPSNATTSPTTQVTDEYVDAMLQVHKTVQESGFLKFDSVHYDIVLRALCNRVQNLLKQDKQAHKAWQQEMRRGSIIESAQQTYNERLKQQDPNASLPDKSQSELDLQPIQRTRIYETPELKMLLENTMFILVECLNDGFLPTQGTLSILFSNLCDSENSAVAIALIDKIGSSPAFAEKWKQIEGSAFTAVFRTLALLEHDYSQVKALYQKLKNIYPIKPDTFPASLHRCAFVSAIKLNDLEFFNEVAQDCATSTKSDENSKIATMLSSLVMNCEPVTAAKIMLQYMGTKELEEMPLNTLSYALDKVLKKSAFDVASKLNRYIESRKQSPGSTSEDQEQTMKQ